MPVRTYIHKKAQCTSISLTNNVNPSLKGSSISLWEPFGPMYLLYNMIMFAQVCIYNRYIMLIDAQIKFDFNMTRDDYDNDMR